MSLDVMVQWILQIYMYGVENKVVKIVSTKSSKCGPVRFMTLYSVCRGRSAVDF